MSQKSPIILDDKGIDRFLAKSSFFGLMTLYFVSLMHKANKGFTFSGLEKNIERITKNYTHAYFVATAAIGLIEHSLNNEESIFTITYYDPILEAKIKNVIYEKADRNDLGKDEEYLSKFSWKKLIEQVEELSKK